MNSILYTVMSYDLIHYSYILPFNNFACCLSVLGAKTEFVANHVHQVDKYQAIWKLYPNSLLKFKQAL